MKRIFEEYLSSHIQEKYSGSDGLSKACKYALEGKGKRVRPLLSLMFYHLYSEDFKEALPLALAIEMVHIYSLVHDDLPCMDDDDYRRGRPTVHKLHGEALGVLVGDALLSDSFVVLSDALGFSADQKLYAISHLGKNIGSKGMVLGQAQDIIFTGKYFFDRDLLKEIHSFKTGALFSSSCVLGAFLGGAPKSQLGIVDELAQTLGLVFQVRDDLLDNDIDNGKTPGKDKEQNKLTFLKFMSFDDALQYKNNLFKSVLQRIDQLDCKFPHRKIALYDFLSELFK